MKFGFFFDGEQRWGYIIGKYRLSYDFCGNVLSN